MHRFHGVNLFVGLRNTDGGLIGTPVPKKTVVLTHLMLYIARGR